MNKLKKINPLFSLWVRTFSPKGFFIVLSFLFSLPVYSQLTKWNYNLGVLYPNSGNPLPYTPSDLVRLQRANHTGFFGHKTSLSTFSLFGPLFSRYLLNSGPIVNGTSDELYKSLQTNLSLSSSSISLNQLYGHPPKYFFYQAGGGFFRDVSFFKPSNLSVYSLTVLGTAFGSNNIITKYSKNYQVTWSKNINFKMRSGAQNVIELADSSLIFPAYYAYFSQDNGIICRTSKDGQPLRARIIGESYNHLYYKNYIYLIISNPQRGMGRIVKLDTQLNLIKAIDIPSMLIDHFAEESFHERKSYSPQHIAVHLAADTSLLIDTGLNYVIKIGHSYFGHNYLVSYRFGANTLWLGQPLKYPRGRYYYYSNCRSFRHNTDGSFDFIAYNNMADSAYPPGIRHIHLDPKTKKETVNTFYSLPHFFPSSRDVDSIGRATTVCFTDSNEFVIVNTVSNCSKDSFTKVGIYHVKNFDFGDLPSITSSCMQSFSIDTIYTIPATVTLRDTTLTVTDYLDTLQFKDTMPPNYNTPIPYVYSSLGKMVAKYDLAKDSNCFAPINLVSDTGLRAGESIWILDYPAQNHSDTFQVVNLYGYLAKYTGKLRITHIHKFNNCIDIYRDSLYKSTSKNVFPKIDTSFCLPMTYTLTKPQHSSYRYLWHTGDTASYKNITDTGKYRLTVSTNCGSFEDTSFIREKAKLNNPIKRDSMTLCAGALPYTLRSDTLHTSFRYLWSTGDTTSSTSVTSFGAYWLRVNNPCIGQRDTIYILKKAGQEVTPPTHPDSISLCATTYKITRPSNLKLEVLSALAPLWQDRDSLILTKNQKLVFRWTDSCGTVTYDSIYDYQRGTFPPYPKTQKLCETTSSFAVNTNANITQYEFVNRVSPLADTWQPNNNINLKLGPNYIRRDDNCGNQQFDTIVGFSAKQPKNLITEDSLVLCPQEFPYTLTISDTFRTYLWSNGDNLHYSKLKIKNSKFYLTVTDDCYTYTDSIEVKEITTPNEIALEEIYRELCKALEKTRVETKLQYPQYIWNQAPSTKFFFIADTSQNLVTLYIPRRCDTLKDSLPLSWIDPALIPPSYTVDSSYCKQAEGAVKLTLTNKNDYLSYKWKGDSLPYIFVNTLGTTKFFARNLCYEKNFDIPPHSCPLDPIGLPNAFSPNGDKLNDSWGLQGAKNIKLHSLSVYNRWGEKVFETTNPNHSWDGSYKGEPIPLGSYQYYIDYEYTPQGIRKTHRGEVTVVR